MYFYLDSKSDNTTWNQSKLLNSSVQTLICAHVFVFRVYSTTKRSYLAYISTEFVILGDVQILFPPSDYIYKKEVKVFKMTQSQALCMRASTFF
jgi:hypothetical protein